MGQSKEEAIKPCEMCKSKIASSAIICPICKSYQPKWMRHLQYWAALAGLIAVIFSLFTYTLSAWPTVKKNLFGRDSVEIIAFKSESRVVIYNSGDSDLFVSHLTWHSKEPNFSGTLFFNVSVKSKSYVVHELEKPADVINWHARNLSEDRWQRVLSVNARGDECNKWFFFYINDPGYQTLKAFLEPGFRSLPVEATLVFYSSFDGRRLTQMIPVEGVAFQNQSQACK